MYSLKISTANVPYKSKRKRTRIDPPDLDCTSLVNAIFFSFSRHRLSSLARRERHQTSRIGRSFRYKALSLYGFVLLQLEVDSRHIDRFNSRRHRGYYIAARGYHISPRPYKVPT